MLGNYDIKADRSRCVRHRYNKSTCIRCMDACQAEAIDFSDGLLIDKKRCTGCMLCVSACPSEAISIEGYNLERTLADFSKANRPVLSCSLKDGLISHAGGPCLGFLSIEHLVSLPIILQKSLQLNMAGCTGCINSHIIDNLVTRTAGIEGVMTVLSIDALDYQDIQTSRRDFFRMLRGGSIRAVQELTDLPNTRTCQSSYSNKVLPLKRQIINAAYWKCSDAMRSRLKDYYVQIMVDSSCNGCMACAAMCPSGALSKSDGKLSFDTFSCTGCGLCEEFCPIKAIAIFENQADLFNLNIYDKEKHRQPDYLS